MGELPSGHSGTLTAKLATGGRFLIALGHRHKVQLLTRILRRKVGKLAEERRLSLAVVPLF